MRSRPLFLAGALVIAIAAGTLGTPPAAASDRVVVVQAGQTLSQIAAAHGTTVERLVTLNHIADPNRIFVGQRLRVRPAPTSSARPAHRARLVVHRIAYGETLTGIAAQYGTTVGALVIRNHLADASRIYAGQVLRIAGTHRQAHRAGGGSAPAHHARTVMHVVRAGETLSGIALSYRVTVDGIAAANRLANPSFIRTGQQLRIPGAQRSHPARPSHPGAAPQPRIGMPPSMAAVVRQRSGMRQLIANEARRQDFPRALALAVAWQESGWQERVVSSAGAIGVMQLLPATADWVSATMLGERVNLWQARSNVRAGVALLKHYLARYGSRPMALAAYYQGQVGTDRYGIYPISQPYIASILLLERMFGG
ncbi:MAG TPA: LysM peptidoglycan-binding domain-containing protein [Candidatus Limnocylindria bacterium]|nr:LysM peptidoglycan-binding domain-containing protein [Candidatus Limnocylindria bacterium]